MNADNRNTVPRSRRPALCAATAAAALLVLSACDAPAGDDKKSSDRS